MNSHVTDRMRAMSAFVAESKYSPRDKLGFKRFSGATNLVRIPNPMSIRPHCVTKTTSSQPTARLFILNPCEQERDHGQARRCQEKYPYAGYDFILGGRTTYE